MSHMFATLSTIVSKVLRRCFAGTFLKREFSFTVRKMAQAQVATVLAITVKHTET